MAWDSLSPEEVSFCIREVARCMKDPVYYLQNYHFIRRKDLTISTIYPLYDSQQLLLTEFMRQFRLKQAIRIIVLKSRQQGICLDPATRVLTADLKWVPISDLKIGTEIISVDELSESQRKHRKMRTGVVQDAIEVYRKAYRITLDDGRTLVCTGPHPWMSRAMSSTTTEWMSIEGNHLCKRKLKVGCEIRWITKPWEEPTVEDGWMGGLLDGEGSLSNSNRKGAQICITQKEGAVFNRAFKYFSDRGYHANIELDEAVRKSKFGKERVPRIAITRMDEIFRIIGQTKSTRFTGRKFWENRELPGKKSGIGWAKIISIEPIGYQPMIDLQTSNKTYIAEGFVSHNTTLGVALMSWLVFLHPICHVLSMSDTEDKVDMNFGMARNAHKMLPWWMKPEKRYDQMPVLLGFDRIKAEDREDSPGMESMMMFEAANKPSGAAYSKSLYGAHLAEIGRYRNAKPITEGVFGSLVGFEHSVGLLEGTAQGRHTIFHKLWKKAEAGKFWAPVFMEWFREPGYMMVVPENFKCTREEEAIKKKCAIELKYVMSDEQIYWRRQKYEEFEAAGDEEHFNQEYPLTPAEAFVSGGLTAFPKKRLREMSLNFGKNPRWKGEIKLELKDNKTPILWPYEDGRLWMWEFPVAAAKYQIAADCALGIDGGDYSCVQVYAIPADISQPLRQVARWRGYMPPTEFARVLCAIGYLFNTGEIAPECNKIDSVASDSAKVIMYPSVYRWIREDKIMNQQSQFIGWLTTPRNKSGMIGRMRDALLGWTVIIRCEEDIDEMFDFVEKEPGSQTFGAREGGTDDTVMANLICFYTATQLRPRWAIDEDEVVNNLYCRRCQHMSLEGDKLGDPCKTMGCEGFIEEKPKADFQNSDFSPIWDKEGAEPTDPGTGPSFAEL
jgi:hypothetical protein